MVFRVSRCVQTLIAGSALLLGSPAAAQAVRPQLQPGFRPDPGIFTGLAGGPVDHSQVGEDCAGHFPVQAQHQIVVRAAMPYLQLFTVAAGGADVTMAIVGPGGVRCDDDGGGSNQAKIAGAFGPGTYNIFIGSYVESAHPAYELVFSGNQATDASNYRAAPSGTQVVIQHTGQPNPNTGTSPWNANNRPVTPPSAHARLDQYAQMRPTGSSLRLSVRRPNTVRARARTGGSLRAAELDGNCRGHIYEAPTYNVVLDAQAPLLRFFVASASDTTLLVRAPDGTVSCDDDSWGSSNRNPLVTVPGAAAGTYAVWVGIYQPGSSNLFQMTATTNATMRIQ